jgi:hypothetical protein
MAASPVSSGATGGASQTAPTVPGRSSARLVPQRCGGSTCSLPRTPPAPANSSRGVKRGARTGKYLIKSK